MKSISKIEDYLKQQGVIVAPATVKPSFLDYKNELKDTISVDVIKYAKQSIAKQVLTDNSVESMSLASMYSVLCMGLQPHDKVLDVCAAPGMKGLYMNLLEPSIEYSCNDISVARISRLKILFDKHLISINMCTNTDGRNLGRVYEAGYFDRIIIDAPCSGEGVALAGNDKILQAWSPAKVKRLQQLQIHIVKTTWRLLKPGGKLVYATCTLNKNENERVIKKALGINLSVSESPLSTKNLHMLKNGMAYRIMPSENSIGFFVATIDKTISVDN